MHKNPGAIVCILLNWLFSGVTLATDLNWQNEFNHELDEDHFAETFSAELKLSSEIAQLLDGDQGLQRLSLEPSLRLSPAADHKIKLGFRYKLIDHLAPESFEELSIREFHGTQNYENGEISLGLQQVNWGKADRIRVLDRVHGFDQSEFTLRPLAELRRPDWMLRNLYDYSDTGTAEFILIPSAKVDKVQHGSRFAPPYPDGLATSGRREELPAGKDAIRLGLNIREYQWDVDWSIVALLGPSSEGAYRTEFNPLDGGTVVVTEYRPETLIGLGFETPWNSLVIRGEGSYLPRRYVSVRQPTGLEISHGQQLNGLLGVDWSPDDWLITGQIAYSGLFSVPDNLLNQKEQLLGTLTARKEFLQNEYAFNASLSSDLDAQDIWARINFSWFPPHTNLELSLGLDVFDGDSAGAFGRYHANDRLFLRIIATW